MDPTGEVVVIIHGIADLITGAGHSPGYSNQFQILLNQFITQYGGQPERFVEALWDGDAVAYGYNPTPALNTFISALHQARQISPSNNCVHVIAHSWGTVISYQAWVGDNHYPWAPTTDIHARHFFTMGSPWNSTMLYRLGGTLGDFTRRQTSIYNPLWKPSQVEGNWWNFWSTQDPISGPIPAAINFQITGGHSNYWSNPDVLSTIAWQIVH
jgi:pimeloyl-ACP methyl ester carboxylesterase